MKTSFWNNQDGLVIYEFGWGFFLSTVVFLVVISIPLGMVSWSSSQRLASVGVAMVGEVVGNNPRNIWQERLEDKWDVLVGAKQRLSIQVTEDLCFEETPYVLTMEWVYDKGDVEVKEERLECVDEPIAEKGALMVRGYAQTSWAPLIALFPPEKFLEGEAILWVRAYEH